MARANPLAGAVTPIPTWRRRYPSDMATARQSQPDQRVTKDMLKIKAARSGSRAPRQPERREGLAER